MILRPWASKPRAVFRVLFLFAVSVALTYALWTWHENRLPHSRPQVPVPHDYTPPHRTSHPIDYLMIKADATFARLLSKETVDLSSAARAYRRRRGRHPPPGFAQWYQFAKDKDALMIEDLFDQIYHDLTPFWAVKAQEIRKQSKDFSHVVSVRSGKTSMKTDKENAWMDIWSNLTSSIQDMLPDVDIPINVMDESRVIVPWEQIHKYVNVERKSRMMAPKKRVSDKYTGLADLDANPGSLKEVPWVPAGPFWDIARVGCAPDTPSRNTPAATDFAGQVPMPTGFPKGSFDGYVLNWTDAKDPCLQPDLREIHGSFIEPVSQSTTRKLIPIFGGSKLPMNNDILIPPAMYWWENSRYSGGEKHGHEWGKKLNKLVWRGVASGGRSRNTTWTRFQRHRFVSSVNGTAVQLSEQKPSRVEFGSVGASQSYRDYRLTSTRYMNVGKWIESTTDVGFIDLVCFPSTGDVHCPYTDPYYEIKPSLSMEEQYAYKYLPDIDGNSFSGRYLGFLRSTSLPIKATVYSEWHDSRLIPWVHFVPMDNSFVDLYGILDYFLGPGVDFKKHDGRIVTEEGHDQEAKKIAMAGKEWAERVLRPADMQIYMLRLLLEFARVCDDKRDVLGFVGDV